MLSNNAYQQPRIKFMKRMIVLFFASVFVLAGTNTIAQELPEESSFEYSEDDYDDYNEGFGLGLGLKLSTFGAGAEIIAAINPTFQVRVGGTYLKYKYTYDDENVEVNGSTDAKLSSVSLLLNVHLVRILFVSGGVLYNMNEIGLNGYPTESLTIGAMDVEPQDIGELSYKVTPGSSFTPYAGIGIGRSLSKNGVVSFAIEAGAAFHGQPKVDLEATGMLSPTASEENRQILEDNLSSFTIYPMLNFQLSFRFL